METYDSIGKSAKSFMEEYPKLTDYEALSLAIQEQRNRILIAGLNVSQQNSYPSALEAIAIQLGYKQDSSTTIIDALSDR